MEEQKNQDLPDTPQGFWGVFNDSPVCFVRLNYFWRLKKSKFILKIFLTKVKHYCMKLNYSSIVKCNSPETE